MHHSFDIHLAQEFGIEEAIIIHHFQHWIRFNKKLERNFRDGRTWSYQTQKELQVHFPYMKLETIKYTLELLVGYGILIRENYNKNPIDKTWWYAFVDEERFLPALKEGSNKVYDTEYSVSTRNIPPPIPDTIPQMIPIPPPLTPPVSDPMQTSPEEEEEIQRRIKERPQKYGSIKNMRAWKETALREIRELVKDKNVSRSIERERRKEARPYDMKMVQGFMICCGKESVETAHGQTNRFFRYDCDQKEWDELPWRRSGI
jgi:hypothetical protein